MMGKRFSLRRTPGLQQVGPANSETDALVTTLDILPTIAAITGTPLPAGRAIDGVDISSVLHGGSESPRSEFLYYNRERLDGIRRNDWKLLVRPRQNDNGENIMLFNLANDIGEKNNLAPEHPEIVQRLRQRMTELDAAIAAEARPAWKKP